MTDEPNKPIDEPGEVAEQDVGTSAAAERAAAPLEVPGPESQPPSEAPPSAAAEEPAATAGDEPGKPVGEETGAPAAEPAETEPAATGGDMPGEPVAEEPVAPAAEEPAETAPSPGEPAETEPAATAGHVPGEPVVEEPVAPAAEEPAEAAPSPSEPAETEPAATAGDMPGEPVAEEPVAPAAEEPAAAIESGEAEAEPTPTEAAAEPEAAPAAKAPEAEPEAGKKRKGRKKAAKAAGAEAKGEEQPEEPQEPKSENMNWYILKVQSNREDSIREGLLRRVAIAGLKYYFGDVIVPTEKVTEFKGGKKRVVKRKLYPGYLVVQMEITDDTWFLVRETPGIGDFTGAAGHPTPMLEHEVARILAKKEEKTDEAPKLKISFNAGDRVKITDGTFENFEGEVSAIDETNGRVTVMINIFNRSTPVELEYWQVEAI